MDVAVDIVKLYLCWSEVEGLRRAEVAGAERGGESVGVSWSWQWRGKGAVHLMAVMRSLLPRPWLRRAGLRKMG